MYTNEKIEAFAAAARSLFVIGNWKWFLTNAGRDTVPTEGDIKETCWTLVYTCDQALAKDPTKTFTTASTGRVTCVLVRGSTPNFTLDITPRT